MFNPPTKKFLKSIPRINSTEHIPLKDKFIYLHLYLGASEWWVAEYDPCEQLCFGFAILNGDYLNAEFGYFSWQELLKLSVYGGMIEVMNDTEWKVKKASKVEGINTFNGRKKC